MSFLNFNYPEMEIALSTVSEAPLDSGHERKLAGDIVGIREPDIGAGLRELKRYLWLRVEGLEENEWDVLASQIKGFDKRRFCIELNRLKQFNVNFDPEQAKDITKIYQPFIPVDEETGLWLIHPTPINILGLIYDKVHGIYL